MESQRKFPTGLVLAGGLLAVLLIIAGLWISANNFGARSEANIVAIRDDARQTLGQLAPKLNEALGVTSIQAQALQDLFTGANAARYGTDGSKAAMQFIAEQNPNLDQSTYRRVIDMIDGGRKDFENTQRRQRDAVRDYQIGVTTFPRSFFMGFTKSPTPGFIEDYSKLVTSGHAANAFETGIDNGVDLSAFKKPTAPAPAAPATVAAAPAAATPAN